MKRGLVLLIVASVLASCASVGEEQLKIVTEAPPKPAVKVVRREPGSLWSEDSRWNEIYNVAPSRALGDTLRLKVSESLKARFAQVLGRHKPIGASLEEIPTDHKGGDDPKGPKERREVVKPADPEFVDAAITEVLPRGLFAITARQTLQYGATSARLDLTGSIREKDINPDDTVSSDNVLNLNVTSTKMEGQP